MKTYVKFAPKNAYTSTDPEHKVVHAVLCNRGDLIHLTLPDGSSETIECPDDGKAMYIFQYDMIGVDIQTTNDETWVDIYELGD